MVDNYFSHASSSSSTGQYCSSAGVEMKEAATATAAEQDRMLPIANVGRMMKKILPPNAKISKDAKQTMQECVSEFISFVTGEASHKCHKEKRKTVNGDDVCWALSSLGFDDYSSPLKRYLLRYRDLEADTAAARHHYDTTSAAAADGSGSSTHVLDHE